jgi:glc operon protein GlcG
MSAEVCDSGGPLIGLQRMGNAIWASAYGSRGKAVASAAFGRPSGELSERADQPTPRGIAVASGGHMIMGQGAVPSVRNSIVEGACGVGGGTSQQDEDCARAGIAQLSSARPCWRVSEPFLTIDRVHPRSLLPASPARRNAASR